MTFENDSDSVKMILIQKRVFTLTPPPSRYTSVLFVCQWISSLLSALSADLCVLRLVVNLSPSPPGGLKDYAAAQLLFSNILI